MNTGTPLGDLACRLNKMMLRRAQHGAGQEVVLDLMVTQVTQLLEPPFRHREGGASGSVTGLTAMIHLVSCVSWSQKAEQRLYLFSELFSLLPAPPASSSRHTERAKWAGVLPA